jgi:excisionase family DNA binding protein
MKELLTVKEVADILGYHPNHVYILIRSKKIKSKKVLGRVLINRTEIDRMLGGADEANDTLYSN